MKKMILLLAGCIISSSLLGCSSYTVSNYQQDNSLKIYENKVYNISLEYNKDWKLNTLYVDRYEGTEGFFQVNALGGEGWAIDEVANHEATHKLKPYGSSPKISQLTIQGQEARLIMPSDDQPEEYKKQAEIIIKYPKKVKIDGNVYSYFILYADKNNIEKIAKTIKFI